MEKIKIILDKYIKAKLTIDVLLALPVLKKMVRDLILFLLFGTEVWNTFVSVLSDLSPCPEGMICTHGVPVRNFHLSQKLVS